MSYPPPQGQPLYPQGLPQVDPRYNAQQPPQQMQQQSLPPAQGAPPYNPGGELASGMESMSLKARAGTTALLSQFTQGNVVCLEQSGGKSLCINNGDVELIEGRGRLAQFIVHVRRPGVVALQNLHNTDNWIGFLDSRLVGTATGGPYCDLLVGEVDGKQITLESGSYPGQYVGFNEDGSFNTTDIGPSCRYVPFIMAENYSPPLPTANQHPPPQDPALAAAVGGAVGGAVAAAGQQPPPAQLPPYGEPGPQQGGYPPASYPPPGPEGGYPPYQGPPPGQYPQGPPPGGYPQGPPPGQYPQGPPPGGYPQGPPPGQYPQGPPPPQGPQLPFGFNILDSFNNGCTVQLICRSNGRPLAAAQGKIAANGFLGKNNCNWVVVVPPGVQAASPKNRVVMLRNEVWGGIHIAVQKSGHTSGGKSNPISYLLVEPQPDNYCQFNSVQFPGKYVSIAGNHQFFIRMEKQGGASHGCEIRTPFGGRSQANNLHSTIVLQLYLKSSNTYLGINRNGIVFTTANEKDPLTFFVVVDRGMGIYSFHTRKFPGFRLRMENNVLKGKGVADLNADFRLLEMPDGTVCFESVTCKGAYISIAVSSGLQTNLNLKVVTITRYGATENVSMTALN